MGKPGSTAPVIFFFLVLPYGISSGFVSITLPFGHPFFAWKYPRRLHDRVGRLGHDRFSTAWMLHGEALFAIVCTLFALLFLERSTLLNYGPINEKSFASALIKGLRTAFLHRR